MTIVRVIVRLTPEELSARWRGRPSVKTLENWRGAGKGPKYEKIGRAILYSLPDIEAYERENRGPESVVVVNRGPDATRLRTR